MVDDEHDQTQQGGDPNTESGAGAAQPQTHTEQEGQQPVQGDQAPAQEQAAE